ncbi:MAG: NRDE family protein [Rhodocyclaceae bacterium]|nr:NRDE family protein [Rhodocyclaceae bacterium]
MCLILVAWRAHPDYPLVVAANRDEFFARPAAPAAFWTESPDVLAGRDLQAGGTWLGITRRGRFAALTNFRDPAAQRADAASRGQLVAEFLQGTQGPCAYLDAVARRSRAYNGFNLLVGDGEQLAWFSNVAGKPLQLEPGIYGICNHLLDTPWPKVQAAKSALGAAMAELPDESGLFRLLRDDSIHPDAALPRTGVSLEWERLLSAAFVRATGYGTRNSTVLRVGQDGWIVLDEQTWLEGPAPGPRVRYRLRQVAAS